MFKWTNHVKPCQFLPQPHSFSIKTPSFQASWSNPLSPVVWDTFRPGAPPLKNLLLLHQGVVFYSWFLGTRRIGSWVGVSPLGSITFIQTGHEHTWIEHENRLVHQTLDKTQKGAEYFCYKVQREQSMALLKFLSAFWDIFLPHDAVFINCGNLPDY